MSYKLFLDDYRIPVDCLLYMHNRIGSNSSVYLEKNWIIVKDYNEFVATITKMGLPYLISFDHDLADGHYHKNLQEGIINYDSEDFNDDSNKTGYHCAKWLCEYYLKNITSFPVIAVHSMNPVGSNNILEYISNFKKAHNV